MGSSFAKVFVGVGNPTAAPARDRPTSRAVPRAPRAAPRLSGDPFGASRSYTQAQRRYACSAFTSTPAYVALGHAGMRAHSLLEE